MTVLVLCHGNICRSPLATALMRKYGFGDVICAGFKEDGLKSPKKMRDYALEHFGIDLSGHRSLAVTTEMLTEAELILYMDGGQRARLESLWKDAGLDAARGGPLAQFAEPLARYLNTPLDRIGDPMFQKQNSPEFALIMAQLDEAARNFVEKRVVKNEAAA